MVRRTALGGGMLLAAVLLVGAVASGCVTFVRPSRMSLVRIESEPPRARVAVDDEAVGETPVAVPLSRRRAAHRLRLELDGCVPTEVELRRSPSWWMVPSTGFTIIPAVVMVYSAAPWFGVLPASLFIADWWNGAVFDLPSRVTVPLACDPEVPSGAGEP